MGLRNELKAAWGIGRLRDDSRIMKGKGIIANRGEEWNCGVSIVDCGLLDGNPKSVIQFRPYFAVFPGEIRGAGKCFGQPSAVVGSIIVLTSEIRFAGNSP